VDEFSVSDMSLYRPKIHDTETRGGNALKNASTNITMETFAAEGKALKNVS